MIADEISALIVKSKTTNFAISEMHAILDMLPKWQKELESHIQLLVKEERELYDNHDQKEPYWQL